MKLLTPSSLSRLWRHHVDDPRLFLRHGGAVDVERAIEQPLVDRVRARRAVGEAAGELGDGGVELVGGHDPRDQPDLVGALPR